MKLENRTDIQAYYDFANCCNNDIHFISFLLQLLEMKQIKRITDNLENLRVAKYEKDFDFLLDNLQINTIKNLHSIYQMKQDLKI